MSHIASASSISELRRRVKGARLLLDNNYTVRATGDFKTSSGTIIFLRRPADVTKIGTKFVTIRLSDNTVVNAKPINPHDKIWPSEFWIYVD